MIREIALIEIDPDRAAEFEAAVAGVEPAFRRGGALEFGLHRSIEHPGRYRLLVGWKTGQRTVSGSKGSTHCCITTGRATLA